MRLGFRKRKTKKRRKIKNENFVLSGRKRVVFPSILQIYGWNRHDLSQFFETYTSNKIRFFILCFCQEETFHQRFDILQNIYFIFSQRLEIRSFWRWTALALQARIRMRPSFSTTTLLEQVSAFPRVQKCNFIFLYSSSLEWILWNYNRNVLNRFMQE